MDKLRTPLFLAAVACLALAILVELGSGLVLSTGSGRQDVATPGWGIRYLAIIDLVLAYGLATMLLGLLLPRTVLGRVQGIVGLVCSLLGLLAALVLAYIALLLLSLMVALLLAPPFGTAAYLAAWGTFPRGQAAIALSLIMVLKLACCVLLVLAHQRFLQHKGLVVLCALSLALTWVLGFLHGFVPGFLVSIVDTLAALVFAIVGAVWLLFLLVGSILAIVSGIRSLREA